MGSDTTGCYQGYFNDGQTAVSHDIEVTFGPNGLMFGPDGEAATEHWTYEGLQPVRPVSKSGPARLRYEGTPEARLIIASPEFAARVLQHAPQLGASASHKATAKIAAMCIAGLVVLGVVSWFLLTTVPTTLASLVPHSWWSRVGAHVETEMVKNSRQCTNQAGKKALAKLAFKFSENAEANTVRVYKMPFMNAFAMAGGRIVLTSALIEEATSPDEIAGVLAHELGHVKAGHPETQLVRALGLQIIMSILWGGSGASDALAQGGAMLAILRYTRSAEREADAIAIELLNKAKIDPNGLASFFEVLKKRKGATDDESPGQFKNLLRTHPGLKERIANIRKLNVGNTQPSLSREDFESLKNICK